MAALFDTVLEMSIKGTVVIIAVMLARLLLSKAPKKYSYLLWAAVAFRLCVPFSFSSDISIFGIANVFTENSRTVITETEQNDFQSGENIITDGDNAVNGVTDTGSAKTSVTAADVIGAVWVAGAAALLIYGTVSYINVKRSMRNATLYEGKVFCSENVRSPFTMGFIKPKIYIPYGLDEDVRKKIIAHEECHLSRFDHFIKPFAFVILAFHWFNPLCWLAFDRMSLDMEMSCDEKLLRTQGDEEMKKTYTKALLSFASNRRLPVPSPVNFNDAGTAKKRIKNMLNYKKPKAWVTVLACVFCAVMLVACAADANKAEYKDINKEIFAESPYVITYVSNGDGTCTVTDIIIDYSYEGQINVEVPAVSPDGDTVTAVDVADFYTYGSLNVPRIITEKSFNELKNKLSEAEEGDKDRETRRFVSFYDPHTQDGIYVLEPYLSAEEYDRLSESLKTIVGYTAQDAYDAAVEALNTLPANSDEAESVRMEAFEFFYHSANKVKSVCIKADASVNGLGNVNVVHDIPIDDIPIKDSDDNEVSKD